MVLLVAILGRFRVRGADRDGWRPPSPPTFGQRRTDDGGRMTIGSSAGHLPSVVCPPSSVLRLQLFHLPEFQFDRGGAAEDRDRDLHPRAALVDLLDSAVERGKRAVGHADLLAHFEGYRGFWPFDALLDLVQDARGLGVRDWHRLVVRAEEA